MSQPLPANLPRQSARIAIPGTTEPRLESGLIIPKAPDNPVVGLDAPGERRRHQELRAQARMREESLLLREIAEVEFSLFSTEDIDRLAVYNVTNTNDYGPGSIRDPKGGPQTNSQTCETCQNDLKNCPGHFGKIVCPRIMHPLAVKSIESVVSSVCGSCGGLRVNRSDLETAGILRMKGEKRLQAIKDLVQEMNMPCTRYAGRKDIVPCAQNPRFLSIAENKGDYRLHYTYSAAEKGNSFPLPPDVPPDAPPDAKSIYKILNNISTTDAELLGFSAESHPRNMILNRLVVIPYIARPDLTFSDKFQPDDFTFIYKAIVSKVNEYNRVKDNEAAAETTLKNIYFIISHLMKNDGKYHQGGRRILTDVKKRIQGKGGVVRLNIMGKRVNFAGRTVIGPGHELRFDEIGIPRLMAERLTRPETVLEHNRAEFQAKYDGGRVKHITMQTGKWAGVRRAVTDSFQKEFPSYRLQIGDIIERTLQNGDIIIFNRQPSLHKGNMMAARARLHDDRIIKLNLSHTTPQNADFDGDEMNIHIPQTIESYAEAEQLLFVARNLMAPQRNEPMMGIVYDALSGAYVMTLPQYMLDTIPTKLKEAGEKLTETPVDSEAYRKIQRSMDRLKGQLDKFREQIEIDPLMYNYCISRVMDAPQFQTLYGRLKKYEVNPYTGRGLVSAVFPEDFDYDAFGVLIQEGIMTRGVLNDKTIGRTDGSIIQEMYKQMGGLAVVDFMTDIQFLQNAYLELRGLSVGLDDCVPTDPEFQDKVNSLLVDATMRVTRLRRATTKIEEEQRERKVISILEGAKTKVEELIGEFFEPQNAIMIMSQSGAKGKMLNAIQMAAILGQQKVGGQRITADLPGNRSLPIFRPNDPDPRSRGFCWNSFATGLNPAEFFFHSMGGRENLTDTAINTAQTGFLQHQIIKSAEDIHIGTDGSVRAIDDTIVQPVYGDDSMDSGELTTVIINGEKIPFFRHLEQLASKINRKYGAQ